MHFESIPDADHAYFGHANDAFFMNLVKSQLQVNMDHDMHHSDMLHASDWDMDCMMGMWGCDSAISLGASAAALAATMAVLM